MHRHDGTRASPAYAAIVAPLTDDGLGSSVIDRLISSTMAMLDMYIPAVLSVIYGNELPKDAIRCVEAGRCDGGEAERGSEAEAE